MKLAIVGLGSIGRRHLGNFRAVGVETLTAYDASPAQREAAARQFPFADDHRHRSRPRSRARRAR